MGRPAVGHSKKLVLALVDQGRAYYRKFSWHGARDPYSIFIAEYFLRRTTRTAVARVYKKVLDRLPTLEALAGADPEELVALAREAGLFGRTRKLVTVAQELVAAQGFRADREHLLKLTAVGPYIADAVLLYAYSKKTFPLDSSVQRVLYRSVLGADPKKNSNPYKDMPLAGMVADLTEDADAEQTRLLHQGVLAVAWETCRPRPICPLCPIEKVCYYPSKTVKASTSSLKKQ